MATVILFPVKRPSKRDAMKAKLELALAHRTVCYRAMMTTQRAWRDADDKVDAIRREMAATPDDQEPPPSAA